MKVALPDVLRGSSGENTAPEWAVATAIVGELRRLLPSPDHAQTALCMAMYQIDRLHRHPQHSDDEFVEQVATSLRLLCNPTAGEA